MRNPLLTTKTVRTALTCLAALALALGATSCDQLKKEEPTTLKFVVPEGFRGVFQITKLDAPERVPNLVKGQENVIKIPAGGLVQMRDMSGFIMAMKVKCEDTAGNEIEVSRPDSPAKGIRLFPIYAKTGEDQYYLVGTAQERDYIWENGKSFIKLAKPVLPEGQESGGIAPPSEP